MYYEVIYEDGSHSICDCSSEDDLVEALKDHHNRAMEGLPSGSAAFDRETGAPLAVRPATRIKRVLAYDSHPADLSAPDNLSRDELTQRFNDALEATDQKGVHDWQKVLFLMSPQPRLNNGPHDSNYPAKEKKELKPALWGGAS